MSPRICHVTTAHPVFDNRIFHKECTALASAGFDTHLIAVSDQTSQSKGVRIHPIPRSTSRKGRILTGYIHVWRTLKKLQPDLVQVHDPELIPLAVAWRWSHRTPAVYDAHEDLPKQIADKQYIPARVRRIAAVAARGLELMADRLLSGVVVAEPVLLDNFSNRRLTMVQNFPWASEFPAPTELPATSRVATYVGGISVARGIEEMVRAIESMPNGASLLLAGRPYPTSLVEALRDRERIDYLGSVEVSAIPEIISQAMVGLCVLHPRGNYVNAQSTKIFEYMAAARPFIASNFPRWVAMLEEHNCGVFIEPQDYGRLAAALEQLFENPEESTAMGLRGRAAFLRHFTFDAEVPKLLSFVASICGPSDTAHGTDREDMVTC